MRNSCRSPSLSLMRYRTLQHLIDADGRGPLKIAKAAGVGRASLHRWCRGTVVISQLGARALAAELDIDVLRVLAAAMASRKNARRAARRKELAAS